MTFRGWHPCSVLLVTIFVALAGLHQPTAFAQDCPELMGRWPYGPAWAVARSGDHAYFGSGPTLLIADVSAPGTPP